MKTIQNDEDRIMPWFPERRVDVEKLKAEDEERKELRSTMIDKAKKFQISITTAFIVTCVSAIAFLITIMTAVTLHKEINPQGLAIATGIIMMIGIVVSISLYVAKHIWKRKLIKKGLYLPFEYD